MESYGTWIDQQGLGKCSSTAFTPIVAAALPVNADHQIAGGIFGPIRVSRPVIRSRATRNRPVGCGAWELTARSAYLDFLDADVLNDSNGQSISSHDPRSCHQELTVFGLAAVMLSMG